MNEKLPNYDRWLTTPPENKICCKCIWCRQEIYIGEKVYHTIDGNIHIDCFEEYSENTLERKLIIAT